MKNSKTLKKLILGSFFLLGSTSLFAQTQKVHTLQAKNSSTSTVMNSDALIQMDSDNKGLLLPRIALTGANQVAPLTAHTAGMVVYNTATVVATATIEAVTPGYYYNNGTKWVKIANTDTADITDDAWINNSTGQRVELATKADGITARVVGEEVVITDEGKIGVGTDTPTAKLEVSTSTTNGMRGIVTSQHNDGLQAPFFIGKKSRGTRENPTAIVSGDYILGLQGVGYHSGNDYGTMHYSLLQRATENWTPTAQGSELMFFSTNNGTSSHKLGMIIKEDGNVGIGTDTPHSSALLDVQASNKGFLPPRVALTGNNDTATIASPATGLLVYNTANAGTGTQKIEPGHYYFNGTNWKAVGETSDWYLDETNSFVGGLALITDAVNPTTANTLYTEYVTLQKGVYQVHFYNCISASTPYYVQATAESSSPTDFYSTHVNYDANEMNRYTTTSFTIYVKKDGTPVRFKVWNPNDANATITVPNTTDNCAHFEYNKVSE